ncbi:NAD(P)-dependent alcohol dehydrogenase [Salinisphaera sp. SPP-AMP-43]|uniref:NAD(P)-dependent alcohol dehydrogenase n=1 Tax=Salinisphaera sp. SPP-AMP-43 TaxID=3121288 RepID=UPI003C6E3BD5
MCRFHDSEVELLSRDGRRRRALLQAGTALAAAPLAASMFARTAQAQKTEQPADTARSVQAWAAFDDSGDFAPHTISRRAPGRNDVVIDILYSSICHSDIHTVRADWGRPHYPVVPGHEMIGRVVATGADVVKFREGDTAGVGTMVDSCGVCAHCVADLEQHCLNGATFTYDSPDPVSGGVTYGGYSKRIVVDEDYVLRIPPGLDLAGAAPLLCAGITTFSPLNTWHLEPGQRFAVIGMGGLGHLAVKLAAAKGAEVTVFTTSQDKLADAKRFGAAEAYLWSPEQGIDGRPGRFDLMLSTVPESYSMQPFLNMLTLGKTLVNVGALGPLEGPSGIMLSMGRQNLGGSLTGGIAETQRLIDFAAHKGIAAEYEMIAPSEITAACQRVVDKQARYRYVIDMSRA